MKNMSLGGSARFPIVTAALVAVVALLLAGGWYAGQHFRGRVGMEPAAGVAAPSAAAVAPVGVAPISAEANPSTTSPAPTAEQQIRRAYQHYLDVYSEAVRTLDPGHLSEVLDGNALKLVTDEVNGLKSQGRPVQIVEDQRFIALTSVTDQAGTLIDEYTSRSVYIDPATQKPLPRTGPPTHVRQSYVFRNEEGTWRIVDGTRENLPPAPQP